VAAQGEDLVVELRGSYDLDRLERAIQDALPLLEVNEPVRVRLDLGGVVFLGPTTIALLEAAIRRIEEAGHLLPGGSIVLPRNRLTERYLHRMDFFRGLATVGDLAEDFERRNPVGFRPCQQFQTELQFPGVSKSLTDALAERCNVGRMAKAAILICLNELTENVIHHAYTDLGGFAACQATLKKKRFEVGIVDLGVGIRQSLAKNPKYADIDSDVTAIETALQPRVTATPDRNSGIGLSITKLLLRDNGGQLIVRSGAGLVVGGAEERAETRPLQLPGTIVAMRARTDQPLDIGKIYEALPLDDEDENDA
jgi:anti-sigma regulatory factor (Ser/Thr protein kinase)